MTTMLEPFMETARRTTPRFILFFILIVAVTYAVTHLINAITAPINEAYAVWTGVLLILATVAAGVTIITTLTLDSAEGHAASLGAAVSNLTKTLRTLGFVLTSGFLIFVATAFAGYAGLAIMGFLIAWLTPLTLYPLINEDGNPFSLIAEGIVATVTNSSRTLPVAIATLLLNTVGVLSIIGVFYTLPYTTLTHGILYRDVYGTLD